MKRAPTLDELPLFADDMAIGAAVLGAARAGEWKAMTPLLEARGLPKIDVAHGGRYVRSVARWYEFMNGATTQAPVAPRGIEKPEGLWTRSAQKRRA